MGGNHSRILPVEAILQGLRTHIGIQVDILEREIPLFTYHHRTNGCVDTQIFHVFLIR